jgi:asparagine synthase (glutamine-hydrolysing)
LSIPAGQLLRPGQRRSLMRRALVDHVPASILSRRTKGYVAQGVLSSFQSTFAELKELFTDPVSAEMGFIDKSRFLACLKTATHGNANEMVPLLKGIYLELWLRNVSSHGAIDFGQLLRPEKAILSGQYCKLTSMTGDSQCSSTR